MNRYGIRLERTVTRSPATCWWCRYPLEVYSPQYSLVVGGVRIVPPMCSARCSEREALAKGRGTLVEIA